MRKLILGNIATLLFLLIIVEATLRILKVGYGSAPLESHQVFHHVFPADYEYTQYSSTGDYGGHPVYFDKNRKYGLKNGRTDLAKEGKKYIAFLGDSFVVGKEVPYEKTFFAQLKTKFPNLFFENHAVTSYSPTIHYLLLKNKLLVAKKLPDMVVLFLYSNDISDDQKYLKNAKYIDGELTAIDGGKKRFWVSLLRKSYLIRWIRKTQLTIKHRYFKNEKTEGKEFVVGGFAESFEALENSVSEKYILKMDSLLRAKKIPFAIASIPSKYCYRNKDYETEGFGKKAEKWTVENGIDLIPLSHHFQERAYTDGSPLFFEKDIHFNEAGHNFMAEVLSVYFKNAFPLWQGLQ